MSKLKSKMKVFKFRNINLPYKRPCHSSGGYSPASHCGGPGSSPGQVMWDLWSTKWHWGRFPPSTSVSPANSHSTDCSTSRSQWLHGLRHEPSSPARTLGCGFESQSRHGCLCVRLFCVCVILCVGSGLATGWSPSESYRLCKWLRNWKKKRPRSNKRTVEPQTNRQTDRQI
jgi:hypothetical protein